MNHLPTAASQLDAMLHAFPDVLFTLDEDGTILDYKGGQALSTLFAAPEVFVGRAADDVLPAGFADGLRGQPEGTEGRRRSYFVRVRLTARPSEALV